MKDVVKKVQRTAAHKSIASPWIKGTTSFTYYKRWYW